MDMFFICTLTLSDQQDHIEGYHYQSIGFLVWLQKKQIDEHAEKDVTPINAQ